MIFAYFRLAWARAVKKDDRDERIHTLQYLQDFTQQLSMDIGLHGRDSEGHLMLPDDKMYGEYTRLLARCYVELGQWMLSLRETNVTVSLLTKYWANEVERPQSDPSRVLASY